MCCWIPWLLSTSLCLWRPILLGVTENINPSLICSTYLHCGSHCWVFHTIQYSTRCSNCNRAKSPSIVISILVQIHSISTLMIGYTFFWLLFIVRWYILNYLIIFPFWSPFWFLALNQIKDFVSVLPIVVI